MLGPMLSRIELCGYSDVEIQGPMAPALSRHTVIGLYFSADWCQPCSVFTLLLKKLYAVQKACGAEQLEVVLVSQCCKAKATKHYQQHMPWLSMWHDAKNEVGMESHTSLLMAKYGITSIPALLLLDQHGGLICANTRDKCVADAEGRNFTWRQHSQIPQIGEMGVRADSAQVAKGAKEGNPPPGPQTQAPAQARWILVVDFDLPPQTRRQPEPTCAKPHAFSGGRAVGVPVGSQAGAHGGQATTSTMGTAWGWQVGHPFEKRVGVPSKGTERGWPLGFTDGTQARPSITRGTVATVTQSREDTDGREQACKSKRKSPPPDEFGRPNLPPKPNFGGLPSPHRQCRAPKKGKPTSLMQPQPLADVHPFTLTLKEWKHGIEVDCGPNWTWDVMKAAIV
jgi:hypothetical protein